MTNGVTVLVGSRNFERGEAAAKDIGPGAIALQLDVTGRNRSEGHCGSGRAPK